MSYHLSFILHLALFTLKVSHIRETTQNEFFVAGLIHLALWPQGAFTIVQMIQIYPYL